MNVITYRTPQISAAAEHEEAVRHVAAAVHCVNQAISQAVEAGISVELVRDCRYHDGRGNWGDQMTLAIK